MTDIANFLFSTQVIASRPHTTVHHASRPPPQEVSPYLHLKTIRDRAKSLQREYLDERMRHHAVKKSLETVTHKSLIKRTEFLKVYGNKKAKFQGQELLAGKRQQRERFERKSMQAVKRRKLQYELQHILRQNEQQDRIYQMQLMNKKNRECLQRELQLSNKRELSYKLHDRVKKGNTEFVIRKRDMSTSITLRSKRNYIQRVTKELSMIQHYESILGEVEQYVALGEMGEGKGENSTMCQTLERGNTLFLTSKQTIE